MQEHSEGSKSCPSLLVRSVFCGAESAPWCFFLVITIFLVTGTLKCIVVQTLLLLVWLQKWSLFYSWLWQLRSWVYC